MKLLLAELGWRKKAVTLDQPISQMVLQGLAKRQQRLTQFLDVSKVLTPLRVRMIELTSYGTYAGSVI